MALRQICHLLPFSWNNLFHTCIQDLTLRRKGNVERFEGFFNFSNKRPIQSQVSEVSEDAKISQEENNKS